MNARNKQKNIPDGWQRLNFGDTIAIMEGGGTPSKKVPEYWSGDIPWATVKDISNFDPNATQDYITKDGLIHSSSRLIPQGTMIMPTRMLLGAAVFFNVDVAINQDLKVIRFKEGFDKKYVYFWVLKNSQFIRKLGVGSTVNGISQDQLKFIRSFFPFIEEQKRIVKVLETWDIYLKNLQRKIEVKKNIKTGLMQQLLTGKKRLKGFTDQWELIYLCEAGAFSKGSGLTKVELVKSGLNAVCYGTLYTRHHIKIKRIVSFISHETARNSVVIKRGDIIFAGSGETIDEIGKSAVYLDDEVCYAGGDTIILSLRKKHDPIFFAFYLNSQIVRKDLRRMGQGQSVVYIYRKDLEKMQVRVPIYKEQAAIAEILNKVDDEIDMLEQKKKIIEAQKKFLLNNLVTGRIRTSEGMKT